MTPHDVEALARELVAMVGDAAEVSEENAADFAAAAGADAEALWDAVGRLVEAPAKREAAARQALDEARQAVRLVGGYLSAVLAGDLDLPADERIALAHRVEFAVLALPQRGGAR
jgi:hypothetical protein